MRKNGIDVSKHQGTIDWQKVKNSGVEFAILRAGMGKFASQKDACFEVNYNGCKAAGIPCGVYWYSYAMTAEEAKQEAAACLEVIRGKQFAYPIYFDIEEPKQLRLGKVKCSEIAKAFLETVEAAGYWVGIYSSKSHLESYITEDIRKRYAVWVAHYGVSRTSYSGYFGIWQKSDTGSIPGIFGNVDLDECYVDYPALIQAAGRNGFEKASEPEATAPEYGCSCGCDCCSDNPTAATQRTHMVAYRETLTTIANKYGTSVQEILEANKGKYPKMTKDYICVGWVLKI